MSKLLSELRKIEASLKQGGMPNEVKVVIEDIKKLERSLYDLEEALEDEVKAALVEHENFKNNAVAKHIFDSTYEDLKSFIESVDSVRIGINGNIMTALQRLDRFKLNKNRGIEIPASDKVWSVLPHQSKTRKQS